MNFNQQQAFGNTTASFSEQRQHLFSNNFQQTSPPAIMRNHQERFFGQTASVSHNSSASSLLMDESQFPDYQLTMGGGGPNLANLVVTEPNADASQQLPFSFDEDFSQQTENHDGDDVFPLCDMDDIPATANGLPAADLQFTNPGLFHSQPINIHNHHQPPTEEVLQPSFTAPCISDPVMHRNSPEEAFGVPTVLFQYSNQTVVSAPTSSNERRVHCGNASGFGSAFSSPGEMQRLNQQHNFPTNHSSENFNTEPYQDASNGMSQSGNADEKGKYNIHFFL